MNELYCFTAIILIHLAFLKDGVAVADRPYYPPTELFTGEWAPATFALDKILCERPGCPTLDKRDVCLVAGAEESALFDREQAGRVVAHEPHHLLDGEHAFINEFQH